jgi:gamma-glutamyltranspeptidase
MSIAIHAVLESRIRSRAEAEGLSIGAYLERLVRAEQESLEELESLALEGLNSGAPLEVGATYWQEKHAQLERRLNKNGGR